MTTAIILLLLLAVLLAVAGLCRVAGAGSRDEEREQTLRQRRGIRAANKDFRRGR